MDIKRVIIEDSSGRQYVLTVGEVHMRKKITKARTKKGADRLLEGARSRGLQVLTVDVAMDILGTSYGSANGALKTLEEQDKILNTFFTGEKQTCKKVWVLR